MRGTVACVAKRDLKAGELLDGEGGYTVWGKAQPVALAREALPIGLADHVKMARNVAEGQVLSFADVEIEQDAALSLYREGMN